MAISIEGSVVRLWAALLRGQESTEERLWGKHGAAEARRTAMNFLHKVTKLTKKNLRHEFTRIGTNQRLGARFGILELWNDGLLISTFSRVDASHAGDYSRQYPEFLVD
jgi:hypothetical protein